MEQGRLAASHLFGLPFKDTPELFPYASYTIPEISMAGLTQETLTSNKVPYEVRIAKYSAPARSMMLGDETGMLKLFLIGKRASSSACMLGAARDQNYSYRPGCPLLRRSRKVLSGHGLHLSDTG
jgi:pyruvate/2-oxoglutarate dehydrogenase complex dihydrolipoamide dehydrogenase (E3) component